MCEDDKEYGKANIENDPYTYALRVCFTRWKPFIIRAIGFDGTTRFMRFTKQIPITEKVLTANLRELESDGIITRNVYAGEMPIRVEYDLTESGHRLCEILHQVYDWSWHEMKAHGMPVDPLGEMWHGYRDRDEQFMMEPHKKRN